VRTQLKIGFQSLKVDCRIHTVHTHTHTHTHAHARTHRGKKM